MAISPVTNAGMYGTGGFYDVAGLKLQRQLGNQRRNRDYANFMFDTGINSRTGRMTSLANNPFSDIRSIYRTAGQNSANRGFGYGGAVRTAVAEPMHALMTRKRDVDVQYGDQEQDAQLDYDQGIFNAYRGAANAVAKSPETYGRVYQRPKRAKFVF